ncbi:unnamed protein product [Paramecium primaurelia]|uniref:Cathepsin propeptide inhibitor domain-containing protein n=1 Tax=Paramecium primaurelia TaxID=5886 RepID=A0A8S1MPG2_PARPR|nr:unnamed protein product [Paramecium primaurelia]
MEKSLISVGLLLLIGAGLYLKQNGEDLYELQKVKQFNDWKIQYNKKFSSEQEEMYRYLVFQQNAQLIEAHNNDKSDQLICRLDRIRICIKIFEFETQEQYQIKII